MIRSITQQKPEEEVDQLLDGFGRVFIIGCGIVARRCCALMTHARQRGDDYHEGFLPQGLSR